MVQKAVIAIAMVGSTFTCGVDRSSLFAGGVANAVTTPSTTRRGAAPHHPAGTFHSNENAHPRSRESVTVKGTKCRPDADAS